MDLVQGVSAAFLFSREHKERDLNVQKRIQASQHRVLTSMAEIQITLAQFQSLLAFYFENHLTQNKNFSRWMILGITPQYMALG